MGLPTDYCWFSTRMCGKNNKVQHFYEVFFLQTRCMYTKGGTNKKNVSYFFNFNLKTNECVLNFGRSKDSKVDVTSGGDYDYHCFNPPEKIPDVGLCKKYHNLSPNFDCL